MIAKKTNWGENDRIKLSDVLPLRTPISIGIEASSFCNLKCCYCIHGAKNDDFLKKNMDWNTFKRAVDSLATFEDEIKEITFSVNGEPLMNKLLPNMIAYIKQNKIAKSVTVFTNGILLNHKLGDDLLEAGLDRLRISIQGINSEKYKDICGTQISFSKLIDNISYFYELKNMRNYPCKIFIKTLDKALNSKHEQDEFYRIFGEICDEISIERLVPIRQEVEYSNIFEETGENMVNQKIKRVEVCAQPFYTMYVRSNGNVTPCCISDTNSIVLGNVSQDSLYDIWNSEKLWKFRKMQLMKNRNLNSYCKKCTALEYIVREEDYIDDISDKLLISMEI